MTAHGGIAARIASLNCRRLSKKPLFAEFPVIPLYGRGKSTAFSGKKWL
jgi:hypothetical protein